MFVVQNFLWRFNYIEFFLSLFASVGALWGVIEFSNFVFGETWVEWIRVPVSFILPICGVVFGLIRAWPKFSTQRSVVGTDTIIGVKIGSIISTNATMIVGAPTTFDVQIEDDMISEESVQGKFQSSSGIPLEEIARQIFESLKSISPIEELSKESKPLGNRSKYLPGTVALVRGEKQNALFVALATFNASMKANLSKQEFVDALPRMWSQIRERGDNKSIAVPLLGGGFSRLSATKKEIFFELVASFVVTARDQNVTDHLTIWIHPTDFKKGGFNFEEIEKVLDMECGYVQRSMSIDDRISKEV